MHFGYFNTNPSAIYAPLDPVKNALVYVALCTPPKTKKERPVAYFSRALIPAERCYSTHQQEALALVSSSTLPNILP